MSQSVTEIIFKGETDLTIRCFDFNEDYDRFVFISGDEADHSCHFLDRQKAYQLIEFLTNKLKKDERI